MKTTILTTTALLFIICLCAEAEPGTSGATTTTTTNATIVTPASMEVTGNEIPKIILHKNTTLYAKNNPSTLVTSKGEHISNGRYNSSLFSITSESSVSFSLSTPDTIKLSGKQSTLLITNLRIYAGQTNTLSHFNENKTANSDTGKFYFCLAGSITEKNNKKEEYSGSYSMSVDYQ